MKTLLVMVAIAVMMVTLYCAKDPKKEVCKKLQEDYNNMAFLFGDYQRDAVDRGMDKEFAVADRDSSGRIDGKDLQLLLDEIKKLGCKSFQR